MFVDCIHLNQQHGTIIAYTSYGSQGAVASYQTAMQQRFMMEYPNLNELAEQARSGAAEHVQLYMAGAAKILYLKPHYFGLKDDDAVNEAFSQFWHRIAALPERYTDIGFDFETYFVASLRYMAKSIKRRAARLYDLQAVCLDEQARTVGTDPIHCQYESGLDRTYPIYHDPSTCRGWLLAACPDAPVHATAFRTRIIYVCIKCARLLDDRMVQAIAHAVSIDAGRLQSLVQLGRMADPMLIRVDSRRRGRDAAWVRLGINRRRLDRELDALRRCMLAERIKRDTGVFQRAGCYIRRSRSILSNRRVAYLLGTSKSTVDSGVSRLLKQFESPYTGLSRVLQRERRFHDHPSGNEQSSQTQGVPRRTTTTGYPDTGRSGYRIRFSRKRIDLPGEFQRKGIGTLEDDPSPGTG